MVLFAIAGGVGAVLFLAAVMTSIEVQCARGEVKQAATRSQQEARVAKRLTMYQAKSVQSIERWESFAVHARIGPKRDR